jgi:hypothetical protein
VINDRAFTASTMVCHNVLCFANAMLTIISGTAARST